MGYPLEQLAKIEFGGAIAGEEWSTGCWFSLVGLGFSTPTNWDNLLTTVDGEIGGIWTDFLKGWNASGATLNFSQVRHYNNGPLTHVARHSLSAAAGSGTAPQPGFVSQVISLYTDRPNRASRGRMYLPRTGNAPSASTFQWTTIATAIGQLKTRLHNMEAAFAGLPGAPAAQLCVVSQTGVSTAAVTSLRADSIPDTQHGRTRSLVPGAVDLLTY